MGRRVGSGIILQLLVLGRKSLMTNVPVEVSFTWASPQLVQGSAALPSPPSSRHFIPPEKLQKELASRQYSWGLVPELLSRQSGHSRVGEEEKIRLSGPVEFPKRQSRNHKRPQKANQSKSRHKAKGHAQKKLPHQKACQGRMA